MKEYRTEQRKSLLDFFGKNPERRFSIGEILAQLPQEPAVSRSAVYRNLDRMVQEGLLEKSVERTGRKTLYQYIPCRACCGRIHLRCERCGRIAHLASEATEVELAAMLEKSGFALDERATVLVGICQECKARDAL